MKKSWNWFTESCIIRRALCIVRRALCIIRRAFVSSEELIVMQCSPNWSNPYWTFGQTDSISLSDRTNFHLTKNMSAKCSAKFFTGHSVLCCKIFVWPRLVFVWHVRRSDRFGEHCCNALQKKMPNIFWKGLGCMSEKTIPTTHPWVRQMFAFTSLRNNLKKHIKNVTLIQYFKRCGN